MSKHFECTAIFESAPPPHQSNVRFCRGGSFKTPKLKDFEQDLKGQVLDALEHQQFVPNDSELSLTLIFGYPGKVYPDLDNAAKSVQDALQGILYGNDKLIKELHLYRAVSQKGSYTIEIIISYCDI